MAALLPALRQPQRGAQRPATRPLARSSYAAQLSGRIQSCTRQMSSVQAEQQKASFLQGVDVQELRWEDWTQAEAAYVPRWWL
jgi:hypothetical protein